MGDRHVEIAVAVEVGQGHAAAHELLLEVGPGGAAAILESLSVEAEQLGLHLQKRAAGIIFHMAVGNDQLLAAIGVEISHRGPEAEPRERRLVEPDEPRHILKAARPEVAVEGV